MVKEGNCFFSWYCGRALVVGNDIFCVVVCIFRQKRVGFAGVCQGRGRWVWGKGSGLVGWFWQFFGRSGWVLWFAVIS